MKKTCTGCSAPAACFGDYEGRTVPTYACDNCCEHSNEGGWCEPVPEDWRDDSEGIYDRSERRADEVLRYDGSERRRR